MASLHLAKEIFNLIYPVGSIYLSTSTTNPSTYFGGTWEQVAKESYLLGYNGSNTWFDRPGQNKGSANGPGNWSSNGNSGNTGSTTLNINQIPAHSHKTNWGQSRTEAAGYGLSPGGGFTDRTIVLMDDARKENTNNSGGTQGHVHSLNNHNHFHVSPYYIVVVWRRTA